MHSLQQSIQIHTHIFIYIDRYIYQQVEEEAALHSIQKAYSLFTHVSVHATFQPSLCGHFQANLALQEVWMYSPVVYIFRTHHPEDITPIQGFVQPSHR